MTKAFKEVKVLAVKVEHDALREGHLPLHSEHCRKSHVPSVESV